MDNDYNVDVNLNIDNLAVDDKTDIVISFTEKYEIHNIKARKDIIKILVYSKDKLNKDDLDYDMYIEYQKNLGKLIISKLYDDFV